MKMLTCKDASRLQSQGQDRPLHLGERLSLRLHLLICDNCRRFRQQLDLIRRACERVNKTEGLNAGGKELSPEAKARILDELASRQQDRKE
jgi:hypothetical protein